MQQSTYYGLAGMLPRRYPQAVMTGESVAGLIVSINRIITKAAFESERFGAIAFFVISFLFILVCIGCHCFLRMSPFVRYHTARCQQKGRLGHQETAEQVMQSRWPFMLQHCVTSYAHVLQDGDSVPLEPLSDQEHQNLVSESEKGQETSSLSAKCYGENLMASLRPSLQYSSTSVLPPLLPSLSPPGGIRVRLQVMREIWQLIVAIFVAYVVTLMLFPGLISEIQYNPIGTWTPVLLVAIFNLTDLIAKVSPLQD